jgi:hypothetical protein
VRLRILLFLVMVGFTFDKGLKRCTPCLNQVLFHLQGFMMPYEFIVVQMVTSRIIHDRLRVDVMICDCGRLMGSRQLHACLANLENTQTLHDSDHDMLDGPNHACSSLAPSIDIRYLARRWGRTMARWVTGQALFVVYVMTYRSMTPQRLPNVARSEESLMPVIQFEIIHPMYCCLPATASFSWASWDTAS